MQITSLLYANWAKITFYAKCTGYFFSNKTGQVGEVFICYKAGNLVHYIK